MRFPLVIWGDLIQSDEDLRGQKLSFAGKQGIMIQDC